MCDACYQAGIETYIITFITAVLQFPLVYLSIKRLIPSQDSRYLKFWSLPIALLVISGACVSQWRWEVECYEKLPAELERVIAAESLEELAESTTAINIWAFAPIWTAVLAGIVLLVSLITPVPELYQSECLDPELDVRDNSMAYDSEQGANNVRINVPTISNVAAEQNDPPLAQQIMRGRFVEGRFFPHDQSNEVVQRQFIEKNRLTKHLDLAAVSTNSNTSRGCCSNTQI